MRKLHNKIMWINFKKKTKERLLQYRKTLLLYWSIIWRKIVEEKKIVLKYLGIFLVFLIALQFSRILDSFEINSINKRMKHSLEKKLDECENDNIKYKSAVETFSKRLKIDITDLYRDDKKR